MSFYHRVAPSAAARVAILALVTLCTACAGTLRPSVSPKLNDDALLVLTGFGYGRSGERALRSLAPAMASEGVDLYVPDVRHAFRSRRAAGRSSSDSFARTGWIGTSGCTSLPSLRVRGRSILWSNEHKLPNLASVIYDRSPLQERAPRIAADKLRLFAWLRYGSTVFDLARDALRAAHRRRPSMSR